MTNYAFSPILHLPTAKGTHKRLELLTLTEKLSLRYSRMRSWNFYYFHVLNYSYYIHEFFHFTYFI
jgi:hypothetical protein